MARRSCRKRNTARRGSAYGAAVVTGPRDVQRHYGCGAGTGGGVAGFHGPTRMADAVKGFSGHGNADLIGRQLAIGDTIPQHQLAATRGLLTVPDLDAPWGTPPLWTAIWRNRPAGEMKEVMLRAVDRSSSRSS